MFARGRTRRDERRRRLGQNFLRAEVAARVVAEAAIRPRELVVEVGAGTGALTIELARCDVDVVAIELDPVWAERLRHRMRPFHRVRVVEADFFAWRLPVTPFRVIGSPPFGRTTELLHRLLDDPHVPLARADLILQWEVARKRASTPPSTLLSTAWAPWWEFHLGRRIAAADFRPRPRIDAGVLTILRREPPLLPPSMARRYATFVAANWPFD